MPNQCPRQVLAYKAGQWCLTDEGAGSTTAVAEHLGLNLDPEQDFDTWAVNYHEACKFAYDHR